VAGGLILCAKRTKTYTLSGTVIGGTDHFQGVTVILE